MKVSLVQVASSGDKQNNFNKAREYILEAVDQKADIICLPENFLFSDAKKAEKLSSKYIVDFQNLAKENKINLILGSIIINDGNEKHSNTSLVIDRKGDIIFRYDKNYLYDVEREDVTYRESDEITPGDKIGLCKLEDVWIGIGICVDLRYPEYFRELMKNGAEIIFLPSSFRKITGQLAWDVLTKARAIENQVYFCACGQTGGSGNKERCGHSRIISFDGNIISEIEEKEGVISADLNLDKLHDFRKEFPVLKQIK
ncbi:MAG: carbon-nitrogen hydrolase family protein [Candidatus Staskawiczbacteria bacterium]|nr:carbon-nitrogen hydrolase family protein [Candidatus Staskawiczbacteria bacterium]